MDYRTHKHILSKHLFTPANITDFVGEAFTMMEMILVMSVIVVLFLLTIPNIQSTMTVVNDKGCNAQKKVVDAAILQYKLKYDEIPSSVQQLIEAGFIRERQAKCHDGKGISVVNGQAQ
ncbi:hypothetical protein ERUR111494_00715 [Erysipelothrix urinaevulpis]